ncbi:MAG: alternative ribosome rescue aminoacyl-tRNA hydrolase ArfB [Planctomycetota bacterium]
MGETNGLKAGPVRIPHHEIDVDFARSGGPGGQNVNKVETKVVLHWHPRNSKVLSEDQLARLEEKLANRLTKDGAIVVTSSRFRHQERNREDALAKLGKMVADAVKIPRKRKKTRPSRASKERRIQDKKHRGGTKRMRREPPRE